MKNKILFEGIEFTLPNEVERTDRFLGITSRDIKNGTIKRQSCEICGKEKTDGHHEIYSDSNYKIRWLCHKHHIQLHAVFNRINGVYEKRKQEYKELIAEFNNSRIGLKFEQKEIEISKE
jgi:hypothetical protein